MFGYSVLQLYLEKSIFSRNSPKKMQSIYCQVTFPNTLSHSMKFHNPQEYSPHPCCLYLWFKFFFLKNEPESPQRTQPKAQCFKLQMKWCLPRHFPLWTVRCPAPAVLKSKTSWCPGASLVLLRESCRSRLQWEHSTLLQHSLNSPSPQSLQTPTW